VGESIAQLVHAFDQARSAQRTQLDKVLTQRQLHRADLLSLPHASARVAKLVARKLENPSYRRRNFLPSAVVIARPSSPARSTIWHSLSTQVALADGGQLALWHALVVIAVDAAKAEEARERRLRRETEGENDAPAATEPDAETRRFLLRVQELLRQGADAASPQLTAQLRDEFGLAHPLIKQMLIAACVLSGMSKEQATIYLLGEKTRGEGRKPVKTRARGALAQTLAHAASAARQKEGGGPDKAPLPRPSASPSVGSSQVATMRGIQSASSPDGLPEAPARAVDAASSAAVPALS
jgi:hypothetical protein